MKPQSLVAAAACFMPLLSSATPTPEDKLKESQTLPCAIKHMWGFIGCYDGSPIPWSANMTSLSGSKDLTPKKCQDECRKKGFDLAALRNGDECYCHNNLDPVDKKLDDPQCDSRCCGDKDAKCGGSSGELAVWEDKDNKVKRPKAKVASSSLGSCRHRRKNGTWRTVCDSEAVVTGFHGRF